MNDDAMNMISGQTSDRLLRELLRVLKHDDPVASSEMIEFVDAFIHYGEAINEITGTTTLEELGDLVEARRAW